VDKVTAMKQAIGYCRLSKKENKDNPKLSLEHQERNIREYAEKNGYELLDVIIEFGFSGKNTKRPGLKRLMELTANGRKSKVNAVIVWQLDRLFRNTVDTMLYVVELRRRGIELIGTGEEINIKEENEFMLTVKAAYAQEERRKIAMRTKTALRQKALRNERISGNINYGYALDVDCIHLVKNEAEQAVISQIKKLSDEGYPTRKIAAMLNEAGQRTRKDGLWRHEYVARILARVKSGRYGDVDR
jgi:site-specific DNA recombinase